MKREFTATVFIIHKEKVLLHFHHKLQKWLPPGGHVESNETFPEAAKREVFEETGLEIEFIMQENILINEPNARSTVRPFLCLLEDVPSYKDTPAHQHMDMIYLAEPILNPSWTPLSDPPTRWFGEQELAELKPHQEIYVETLHIIRAMLNHMQNTFSGIS